MQETTATPDSPSHLPEGLRAVTPYLITAKASGVIDFLEAVFGATEKMRVPRPDGSIMHAEVIIGDSVIELSDGSDEYPPATAAVHVYVPDVDGAYQRAILAGASSIFGPKDQPYGDRAAAVRDVDGNLWYIATHLQRPGEFLPHGMHSITPFLHPASAEGQIRFLVEGLGGQELGRHVDDKTFFARVRIDSGIVELSEARGQVPPMTASIHVHVPDCDAVYHRALAAGGASIYPVSDHAYGERSGGVRDSNGNRWWIATRKA